MKRSTRPTATAASRSTAPASTSWRLTSSRPPTSSAAAPTGAPGWRPSAPGVPPLPDPTKPSHPCLVRRPTMHSLVDTLEGVAQLLALPALIVGALLLLAYHL